MDPDPALLAAVHAAPADALPRLVLADWLDERGRPLGAWLRLDEAFARMGMLGESTRHMVERCKADFAAQPELWRIRPLWLEVLKERKARSA